MKHRLSFLILCCALVLFGQMAAAVERPNFILILTDDQSWVGSSVLMDPDLPESRSDFFQTPELERLAARGMRFSQGYAPAPYCCPTRRSLQVGQTPARHVYQQDVADWPVRYREQLTIPRMLKAIDGRYRTAHFGKWDLRFDLVSPEDLGYDVSDGLTDNGEGGGRGSGGPAAVDDPKLIDHLTSASCTFLAEQAASGSPFYLQISHYAVHLDIYYREETLTRTKGWKIGEKHAMPEFAAMTYDVDQAIGAVVDKVTELGLSDNTYIIIMSDNGGRDSIPDAPDTSLPRNHPLRDGKGTMYEGGIRVPFMVIGPGIEAGSVSRVPVTGLDLLPTMADLAGNKNPLPSALDGGSIAPVLRGTGSTVSRQRDYLIFHQSVTRESQSAIRRGQYKLVKTWDEDQVELFDVAADPGETIDLGERMPELRDELHQKLSSFLAEVGAETERSMSKKELKKIFKR